MNYQKKLENMLHIFSSRHAISLKLENGVCALDDNERQEALVIELPQEADDLLLHCKLFELHSLSEDLGVLKLMMMLNFEINAMRGCWLALDEDGYIRLCNQQAMDMLDDTSFETILFSFIKQSHEVRSLLTKEFSELS